ncbi:hypothetical protein MYVA_4856 [Mycolicibacterium vaccae 95051]|nr:hypothetical protein MYVA_4856 [Mycolicibacterium vaccae 95051]
MSSTHTCVWSSLKRPRGQLSGSGWRGRPAGVVETATASPQGTEVPGPVVGGPVGPPPPSKLYLVVPAPPTDGARRNWCRGRPVAMWGLIGLFKTVTARLGPVIFCSTQCVLRRQILKKL